MNESDLERALRDWARADADVSEPSRLRARVMAVPEETATHARFGPPALTGWLRARPLAASGIAAAVLMLFAAALVPLVVPGPVEQVAPGEAASTLVVAQDRTGDHETLADAVAAARDGDIILLRPGTYIESVRIDKDITLRGDGDRDAIILSSPSDLPDRWLPREEQPYAVRLEHTQATVENVTFAGPASALIVLGGSPEIRDIAVIEVGVANRDGHTDGSQFAGLAIAAGSNAQLRDSLFRRADVTVDDGAQAVIVGNDLAASMVQLGGTLDDRSPSHAVIEGNTFDDPWIAIWVDMGATARIVDNEIGGASNAATWVRYAGPGVVIEGNTIHDGKTAVMVVDSPVEIVGNDVWGNQFGINVAGSGSSIRGNQIHGNTVGVLVTGLVNAASSVALENNTVEGNERGVSIKKDVRASLDGNTVCDNGTNLDIVEGAEVTTVDDRICADEPSAQTP